MALSPPLPSSAGPTSARSRSRVSSIAFPGFDGTKFRLLARAVFHLVPVEREDFRFAAFFHALVKSAAGFFAQPAALHHFFHQLRARDTFRAIRRQAYFRKYSAPRGPARRGRQYPRCGMWPISASPPRGRCRRPLPRWSCRALASGAARCSMEKVPMRLAMKLGVSFATTTPLPSRRSQISSSDCENFGLRLRPGNQLDQLHVARRIEEMRAGPMLLKIFRASFGDEHESGRPEVFDVTIVPGLRTVSTRSEKAALDFQIFGDGFDDPIHLRRTTPGCLRNFRE